MTDSTLSSSEDHLDGMPFDREPTEATEVRVREELGIELAKHLLGGRRTSDIGQTLLAAVIVFVFWGRVDSLIILGWFASMVLFTAVRFGLRTRLRLAVTGPRALTRHVRADVWGSAALWAVLAMLLIGHPVLDLALVLIVFAGIIAAATNTLVADSRSFHGFIGILVGPLLVTVALSGLTRDHISLLLITSLYLPFMISVHRRAHAVLSQQIDSSARLKISEEETARSRNFLDALVVHAPSVIAVLDRDQRVLRVNPAFERATGYSFAEARGRTLSTLLASGDEAATLASFLDSIPEGARAVAEVRLERSGGVPMWMRLSGTIAGSQAAGSTILIGEDVSEQVEAREAREAARAQAEQVSRAKSSFLASMSHEIRTPMNGILGMIELLLDMDLNEQQRGTVSVIQTSAEGLLHILNDILDVSKIEAGQLDLEAIDFQLVSLLNEAAQVFVPLAAAKDVELLVDIGEDVPRDSHGDPVRLRQIITNLLSNGVKFTEKGEVVLSARRVSASGGSTEILFSVRDTGVGVPEDKQQAIFREFEQADQSTTRVHGGTGLGLTISRRLVEMMGGSLQLSSQVGSGSDFHFTLTLPDAVQERAAGRRSSSFSLQGLHVLIVDDNATARRISREALAGEGVTADEAASADEGIEMLREALDRDAYDAVILDHLMPERDGFQFATDVSADERYASLPILMLTSSPAASGRALAREAGIGAYLTKPASRTQLVRALGTMLGHSPWDKTERRLVTNETLDRDYSSVKILLAEDNAVNQQVAFALLGKRGYEVEVVGDGLQALEAVLAGSHDLVLMDIQMPLMDGLEATREIRKHKGPKELPIIALTAHAFQEERDRTAAAGMNDFLAKPFKPQALYEIVERWAPYKAAPSTEEDSREDIDMESADARAPVDIEGFRSMMREVGVEEVVDATLAIYTDEASKILDRMVAAVAARDAEEIRQAAHSLKSSSGNIRATRLAELLQELESFGKEGDVEGAAEVFPEVQSEYAAVMSYLAELP